MTAAPVDGIWEIDPEISRLCSKDGSGLFTCPAERFCGHPDDYNLTLIDDNIINREEIFYGIVTFDHILVGMLSIF